MSENPFNNTLFNQIQAIVDAMDSQPRIVQCIQACNEAKLIEACMLQVYDKVDKIIVIEGAVKNKVDAGQATPDGHSLDLTVEIIKDIKANKDPDNKVVFVQIDRPWADLEEIKNTFFQYMQDGDWMLITDADEFIMPEVVDQLREAITLEPWATEFVPAGFYHFWRDAWHMRKPSGDWGQQHQRFIRFQQGLNYANHPVARDKEGVCTYFDPRYLSRRYVLPGFVVYHYSYCKESEEEVRAKKDFYDKELGQDKHGDVGAYARGGQTDEFLNQTEDLDTVLVFDGEHPPAMQDHPIVQHRDEGFENVDGDEQAVFDNYKTVEPYSLEYVPLIWIYAQEGKQGFDKLFNLVDV
ncbi:MAG: hypothetical protein ACXABY_02010 [Candidatus Thorarchaeota archaeon]|jgi:hypothetical protein